MKKIFSLFAAVLFAGSMFAAEESVSFSAQSYTNQQAIASYEGTIFSVAFDKGSNNNNAPKYYDAGEAIRCYGGNTFTVSSNGTDDLLSIKVIIASGGNTNTITTDLGTFTMTDSTWTGAAKSVTFTIGGTSGNRRIAGLVVETGVSTTPAIIAIDFDFGKVVIAEDDYYFGMDTSIVVTGVNLSEAIVASGDDENLSFFGNLTAEGGILYISITVEPGDFSDTITLTSGETVKEVVISGKVIVAAILPGEPATMTANETTKAYEASVDGVAGVKVGTSSANGSFVVTVPANANVLHFYAAAWTGAAGTIAVSAPEGVTLDQTKLNLVADAGISGSDNDFTLQALEPAECRFDINLSGVTEETEITFASGTAKRFVVWGATYELGEETPVDPTPEIVAPYCATEVGHLFEENAAANSFVLLSICSKDGKTIVRIDQDADKNNMLFDYLQVTNLATTGADITEGGETSLAVEFDTPVAVNDSITLEILWSTVDWDGRWMVQNVKIPATAACESAVMPSDDDDEEVEGIHFNREVIGDKSAGAITETIDGVVMAISNGATNNDGTLRIYKGSTISFTAPEGYKLVKIEFTCSSASNGASQFTAVDGLVANGANGTWTGKTSSITFTASGAQVRTTDIVVYIEEAGATVANPTMSVAEGIYTEDFDLELTCATEGAVIYYTLDGTTPTAESSVYSEAIVISATTTVKAIALKEGLDASDIVSATYTFPAVFASLAELAAADLADKTLVQVTINDIIKSFYTNSSSKRQGVYFNIQKEGKDIEIYYNSQEVPEEWEAGGKLSGTIVAPWTVYNGTWELAPVANSWSWANLTYISDSTTGIIDNSIDAKVYKTVINGQVVIVRDGKMINMLGVEL